MNFAHLERDLAGSRTSRAQRGTRRSELADWRSRSIQLPAVSILSAPELARRGAEERGLEERLSV